MNFTIKEISQEHDYYYNAAHLVLDFDGLEVNVSELLPKLSDDNRELHQALWQLTCGAYSEDGPFQFLSDEETDGCDCWEDFVNKNPEQAQMLIDGERDMVLDYCMDNLPDSLLWPIIAKHVKLERLREFYSKHVPDEDEIVVEDEDGVDHPTEKCVFFVKMLKKLLTRDDLELREVRRYAETTAYQDRVVEEVLETL